MSVTLTLRTEEETRDKLDQIAKLLDRNRNWVINEAISNFIELHHWQVEEIRKGEEDIKAGRWLSQEQLKVCMDKYMAKREAERKTKIGK